MDDTTIDKRHSVLVVLEATDRAEHSTWNCPECNNPLVELVNASYRVITDVYDPTNTSVSAVGRRCGGSLRYDRGSGQRGKCRYWYYFSLPAQVGAGV